MRTSCLTDACCKCVTRTTTITTTHTKNSNTQNIIQISTTIHYGYFFPPEMPPMCFCFALSLCCDSLLVGLHFNGCNANRCLLVPSGWERVLSIQTTHWRFILHVFFFHLVKNIWKSRTSPMYYFSWSSGKETEIHVASTLWIPFTVVRLTPHAWTPRFSFSTVVTAEFPSWISAGSCSLNKTLIGKLCQFIYPVEQESGYPAYFNYWLLTWFQGDCFWFCKLLIEICEIVFF